MLSFKMFQTRSSMLLLLSLIAAVASGFQLESPPSPGSSSGANGMACRSDFLRSCAGSAAGWLMAGALTSDSSSTFVPPAFASTSNLLAIEDKLSNISDAKLKEIIRKDVVENQYLCNGQLTRSVYDESATFTDEIDTYKMDQWITGTQKLFVGENSEVRLVGDIDVTSEAVTFRFDEDLQFRIPLRPTVALTGKVVLKRDPTTGLIISYQEYWDEDVATVLKSAKFGSKPKSQL